MNTPNFIIPEIKLTVSFDKNVKKSELKVIQSSMDIAEVLRQVFNKDTFDWTEEFIMLCLNRKNAVVGFYKVSSGGMTGTVADPKVIYTLALQCTATSIVIAHNHPSGNLRPSKQDEELTQKIKHAGTMLDIKLLDHIILNDENYFSFADEGIL